MTDKEIFERMQEDWDWQFQPASVESGITFEDAEDIREMYRLGVANTRQLSDAYNICRESISHICLWQKNIVPHGYGTMRDWVKKYKKRRKTIEKFIRGNKAYLAKPGVVEYTGHGLLTQWREDVCKRRAAQAAPKLDGTSDLVEPEVRPSTETDADGV